MAVASLLGRSSRAQVSVISSALTLPEGPTTIPAGTTSTCDLLKSTSAVMVRFLLIPTTSARFTGLPLRVILSVFLVAKPMFLSKVRTKVVSPKSMVALLSGVALTNCGASTGRMSICASVSWQPVATSATAARHNVLIIFFSFIIQIVFYYSIVTLVQITLSPLSRNEPPQPPAVVICS